MPPEGTEGTEVPVARVGVAVMGVLLAVVLVAGIARNGVLQALGDLGFRSPPIAIYTLLLLSPLFFEGAYPWLRRRLAARPDATRVLANLHRHAPYLILMGIVMLAMRLENVYDLDLTAWLGRDFTAAVHAIEGDVVADMQGWLRGLPTGRFQFLQWDVTGLDLLLMGVYVVAYALYHVVAIFTFAWRGDTPMVKRFIVTWTLIYAFALPFYLFLPVNEVWTTNPAYGCYPEGIGFATDTVGVLHSTCGNEGLVLSISSINNCFPSLHNAFAWALPFLLWQSGRGRTAWKLAPLAFLITLSTVQLGIHWVTDIVAGILLAWAVTWVAVRVDYELGGDLRVTRLTLRRAPAPTRPA